MLLSLNWLKDFVDIPKSITPEELGLKLTMHTVEIDGVEKEGDKFKGVVIGKILEVNKHSNADKLSLAKVDIGKEKLEIVCGAPNIKTGQKVPVALVGTELPNGTEIKEAEIRGVKSSGMLCAEDELGLGEDHSGILILNEKAKLGQPLADYLKLKDVVFEVDNKSITNRPDLWGHYGMAREISTFLRTKKKLDYANKKVEKLKVKATEKLEVKVEDHKLCPRYMGVILDNLTISESPKWMQDRLIASGVRPINNIVDVTNYVMLETGQPLHAFDRNLADKIIVRLAKKNEDIKTLDGEKRELDEEMLVIADSAKPIALAGVMGGENSEIGNDTKTIILESANFDFISIRKTSAKFGLRTESSMRFEKSLDPNLCETALVRAIELIQEISPKAQIASKITDKNKFTLNQGPLDLDLDWLANFLGEDLGDDKIIKILVSLGFLVEQKKRLLLVTIPTWRASKDISIKEDLAEEIARIYGYDNIKPIMPRVEMKAPIVNKELKIIREIKKFLADGASLTEVYNYSFIGEDLLKKLNIDFSTHLRLVNPISAHHTMLRQSLAPYLFTTIKSNQARFENYGFFEVANVYSSLPGDIPQKSDGDEKLPYQEKRLGIALAGKKSEDLFREIKGRVIEKLLANYNIYPVYDHNEEAMNWCYEKQAAQINVNGKTIGTISGLDTRVKQKMGIKKNVVIAEINLQELFNIININSYKKHKELDKFPPVIRDLAFVVDEKVLYNSIKEEISSFHKYIKEVELFDIYEGDKIGRNKKNLAFRIFYKADKTLKSKEVDEIQKKLINKLENRFEAKVRDY